MPAKKKQQRSHGAATAVALTIAGSDSSAGAGAQADLKTFGALGVYGVTAITCIVAETPGKVSQIQPADPESAVEHISARLRPILRLAKQLGPGKTIVTILADSGNRYQSKLFNPDFLKEKNLPTPPWL